jgi:O-antigen/teichoic acid export membrane protein
MSASRRFFSGSIASAGNIGSQFVAQVLLVPIFLSNWHVETYGLWLLVQSTVSVLVMADIGHLEYISAEFLKLHIDERLRRSEILSSSLPFFAIADTALLTATSWLAFSSRGASILEKYIGAEGSTVGRAVFAYVLFWVLFQTLASLIGRALVSVGYFSRTVWWSVLTYLSCSVASAAAVFAGLGIEGTAWANIGAMLVIYVGIYVDFGRLLRREGVVFIRPDFVLGLHNCVQSLALTAAKTIDMLQQTGFRLFVVPFVGLANLAVLSALRTIANVVQHGIGAIINPGAPELMRAIAARDAERTSAIICFLWLLILFLFAPAMVGLQVIGPELFSAWTRGKMNFDPACFSYLSVALILAGLSEPAAAIVKGNNLIRAQLATSVTAGAALISMTWLLASGRGIAGAALALLTAECCRSAVSIWTARRWLKQIDLVWPQRHFVISSVLVLLSATAVLIIPEIPGREHGVVLIFMILYAGTLFIFWRELPADLRCWPYGLLRRGTASFKSSLIR